ncbi:electron transfer flavoprotein-ubiquinone oxidoreductase [Marinomonas polaris]|jgi:electron-transferring-flavoprotein dehydrogenase|uniref:Electron transfer flavoprotein-ubiquinone oxidoreductase n=1 Tax=Marinomonas polaris DSM 16579 TaxID=1122206 RepID=A0A1M4VWS4_9GAMM|nr:electron transfer flavoprotein-ubiquinone oxidoreductase [Marinomonas polaris]SHE73418.1 electron-transferring-flavoprotein dehydrogenase [Marinomonas polaris DSM 16579]
MERDVMSFDVVIVGAGAAGLSAACRLKQLAQTQQTEISVCVVEKGSEVGAHIVSGAVIDPKALNELFPDWHERQAPLTVPATEDQILWLRNSTQHWTIPTWLAPKTMHNTGNYIASLGNLCRWLADQAEDLGVEIFPGFPAAEVIYHENGSVRGILTADMGLDAQNTPKSGHMPGMILEAKFTLFSEGCRGHLGKALIEKYALDQNKDPQHYAIGIKELWDIDPVKHQPGLVIHGTGWPLQGDTNGGFFLYHTDNHQIAMGLIVDLNYSNPWVSPFDECQQLKHHPVFAQYLEGGKRVSYGARAIAKGGFNSLPKMTFPGGLLIGCDAGTLNVSRIKGTHTAMKSGMLAAEAILDAMQNQQTEAISFESHFRNSWLYDELFQSKNFGPALHKLGPFWGGAFNTLEQNLFQGRFPLKLHDKKADHLQIKLAAHCLKINYPKPDGLLSFDKLSSVYLSNTNHEEDQPCHLHLHDNKQPYRVNIPLHNEPAQRFCPAGVYEVIEESSQPRLQINAQNCLHCKTCDIKDSGQNIQWLPPEGGGGPNYPNM